MAQKIREICDLHTHTIFSDGMASPVEYVEKFFEARQQLLSKCGYLKAIALTDHDSINGIEPVLREFARYNESNNLDEDIQLINGMELSTNFHGIETHVLGFFSPTIGLEEINSKMGDQIDRHVYIRNYEYQYTQLTSIFNRFKGRYLELTGDELSTDIDQVNNKIEELFKERQSNLLQYKLPSDVVQAPLPFERKLMRLALDKLEIVPEKVVAQYTAHFNQEKGTQLLQEYYNKLSNNSKEPAKIQAMAIEDFGCLLQEQVLIDQYITTADAIELITRSGGTAVLAHPRGVFEQIDKAGQGKMLELMDDELIPAGLAGLECYYPDFDAIDIKTFIDAATIRNLKITGGTNWHMREGEIMGFVNKQTTSVDMKYCKELFS